MEYGGYTMRTIIVVILILMTAVGAPCFGEWQDTLNTTFDVAETFDELSDWTGNYYMGDSYTGLPTLSGGGASIWGYYSNYTNSFSGPWIGDHGQGNNWSGTKSLALDYLTSDGAQGPSRLGLYLGSGSPGDGYSTIHVFFMIKQTPTFYPITNGDFDYFGYFKVMDIGAGFSAINAWGTTEERSNTDGTVQHTSLYGLNYVINNFTTVSCPDICPQFSGRYATTGGSGDTVVDENHIATGASIGSLILNSEWFGVEYRYKLSSPSGSANGEEEVWIYNSLGTIVAHQLITGVISLADGTTPLGYHKLNKVVFGGNRSAEFSTASIGHHYIDDCIIDADRIGPTYFTLLAGTPAYDMPTITGPGDSSTQSTSIYVEGVYTIDPDLQDQSVIVTWTLGESSGFCVAALGVFSCTVPGLALGANSIVFEITDSNSGTAADTTVVTRTAPGTSSGVTIQGVQWNQ